MNPRLKCFRQNFCIDLIGLVRYNLYIQKCGQLVEKFVESLWKNLADYCIDKQKDFLAVDKYVAE